MVLTGLTQDYCFANLSAFNLLLYCHVLHTDAVTMPYFALLHYIEHHVYLFTVPCHLTTIEGIAII